MLGHCCPTPNCHSQSAKLRLNSLHRIVFCNCSRLSACYKKAGSAFWSPLTARALQCQQNWKNSISIRKNQACLVLTSWTLGCPVAAMIVQDVLSIVHCVVPRQLAIGNKCWWSRKRSTVWWTRVELHGMCSCLCGSSFVKLDANLFGSVPLWLRISQTWKTLPCIHMVSLGTLDHCIYCCLTEQRVYMKGGLQLVQSTSELVPAKLNRGRQSTCIYQKNATFKHLYAMKVWRKLFLHNLMPTNCS